MGQAQIPPFKFCPFCGDTRIELNVDQSCFHCPNCHNVLFFNSKPSVCAVIVRNDRILLVSDSSDNLLWDFPGGFLRYGERPEDGLQRELREELGVQARIGRLLSAKIDTYSSDSDFSLNLFYATQLESEMVRAGGEVNHPRLKARALNLTTSGNG
jgi:ADP-ribose pyrophosphatase YjhB (NUDIX family)